MGTIWIKEFVGGLDTRRMPETTSGGVLIQATDGHINRGGEFEKRPAFVREYALPPDATTGLAAGKNGIYVFGSDAPPTVPFGVTYQRLQHPDGTTELVNVPSYDMFGGKIYAVGEFADGGVYHFYDGVRVPDWFDGRARASFRVTGGSGSDALSSIKVDGISILSSSVTWTTSNSATASAIAASINSATSSPDYTATVVNDVVNIVAADAGANANGRTVVFTTTGGFTVDPASGLTMSDGVDPTDAAPATGSFTITGGTVASGNQITNVTIAGVSLIGGTPVAVASTLALTATAVANAINSYVSTPDYSASAAGAVVTITASAPGSAINGTSIVVTVGGNATVGSTQAMAGGTDSEAQFVPGTFVKTVGSRMHSVSGPNEHFSGLKEPTKWTTDTTGAGFIDMSTQASGSENLTGLAKYQQNLAVFAESIIQIWYFDSDPSQNAQKQVLNNTGTGSPRSITQFGDNDLFYCAESGLRSLRARDASNAAATTDIGVPIDTLVTKQLRSLSSEQRRRVIGLIEPADGRFWLAMVDRIFVFSFFQGAKISAWSMYLPTTKSAQDQDAADFPIDDMAVFNRKVYLRSGDDIYVFGGLDTEPVYDFTEAEAWPPYLDGDDPTKQKELSGFDIACEGEWEVRLGMQPTDLNASDKIAIVSGTTYSLPKIDGLGAFTHVNPRFKSRGTGAAKVSAAVIHYEASADED